MSQVVYITTEPSEPAHVDGIPHAQPDWIHPHLNESADPVKGRQFRATGLIHEGACLLVDRPYAVIPVVDEPASNDNLICSNPACNRRARQTDRYPCPNACTPDLVWCCSACSDADKARHDFECTWLKRYALPIRAKWGEYDFGMLWVIIRLLATRYISEGQDPSVVGGIPAPAPRQQWQKGWDGIDSLCGSADTWSHEQVRSWTALVKKYMQSSPVLPHKMSIDRVLHLVCQEEANSFGLYPRETGVLRQPNLPIDRGEQYAAAVYPTAAIANHSCLPNIIHKPDDSGRMVFTASRDILPGEECCIAYFDLSQYTDLTSRREHLRKSFRFVCRCERCVSEEPADETTEWTAMPLIDI